MLEFVFYKPSINAYGLSRYSVNISWIYAGSCLSWIFLFRSEVGTGNEWHSLDVSMSNEEVNLTCVILSIHREDMTDEKKMRALYV